jgi:monoterpene epsilon-lactone hydrolase
MPSWQSRLFLFLLRYRRLLRFRLKRKPEITWSTSIPELRAKTAKAGRLFGKLPEGIEISATAIGDMYAEWVLPSGASKDKAILYFHGGGYVIGSPQGHRTHVAKFVTGTSTGALVFDYRLAPEHPFPAAIDDAVAAYRYLLAEGVKPSQIAFAGDSAGGGLCLATLLATKDKNLPLPAAAVALSPWTDLACTGESLTIRDKADLLSWTESWTVFSHYYIADSDHRNPWASPLYGDLSGLPPILIYVGENEVLFDDSRRFAEKAKAAGVDITLRVGRGLFHCYPVCAPLFPEATQAMAEICEFIKKHIGE